MTDFNNSTGKHNIENVIEELMNTARIMTENSNDIKERVKNIITSCNTQGTTGDAHKSLLIRKADDMKTSVELFRSVARKYESTAMRLADGEPEEKVWTELLSYNVFISDQLKSEQDSYKQVLSMINI